MLLFCALGLSFVIDIGVFVVFVLFFINMIVMCSLVLLFERVPFPLIVVLVFDLVLVRCPLFLCSSLPCSVFLFFCGKCCCFRLLSFVFDCLFVILVLLFVLVLVLVCS